jgi:hypothetical protein
VLDGLSASLACPVRLLVGGVPKPQGEAEVAARSIRATAGEGKTGRVNGLNPRRCLVKRIPWDGALGQGHQGLAAVERQAPVGHVPWPGGAPPSPGYRGHPPRSQLVRAERGNPVEVRAVAR